MHLVQRLLSLRENKGSGSEEAHSEGFPASGSGGGAALRIQTWCKDSRKTLFFRFPCTKSLAIFGAPTLRTWCKDSRKTLFFRFSCTKSLALFGAFPFRIWCKDSRNPLFLRFPCTKFSESNPPAAMRRGASARMSRRSDEIGKRSTAQPDTRFIGRQAKKDLSRK